MDRIQVIKDYKENEELRTSFNTLAQKTFCLDFEDWYQNGYFTERYNPHSIVMDGKVVANVSVNQTDFIWNGERKRFIQLGTVMTEEAYRGHGYSRKIMEEIEKEYAGTVDGMYLFANDSVLDFYPRFGFRVAKQYQYGKGVHNSGVCTMQQISMQEKADWDKLEGLIKSSENCCSFDMVDNSQLNMFYITKFMQENVYYDKELDVYVVAEIEEDELLIDMVIAHKEMDLNAVVEAFGKEIHKVRLGFTPKSAVGFEVQEVKEADCTLFVKGKGFEEFETARIMFPVLAHA